VKLPIDAGIDPPPPAAFGFLIHRKLINVLDVRDGVNIQSYMAMMEVLVGLQVIPVQFAALVHALAESLQFVQRSVPGRSQRSNSAAASAGLSSASEGEHHSNMIIVTTRTNMATRRTCNEMKRFNMNIASEILHITKCYSMSSIVNLLYQSTRPLTRSASSSSPSSTFSNLSIFWAFLLLATKRSSMKQKEQKQACRAA